jgi:hypothetical protein
MSQNFRIAAPSVLGEIIEGEAIVVDMRNGHYFSADGYGALIWDAIGRGYSGRQISEALLAAKGVALDDQVAQFVAALLAEGLIEPCDAALPAEPYQVDPGLLANAALPPRLVRHTDMEDLILLDPIHDVDDAGWPMRKTEPAAAAALPAFK